MLPEADRLEPQMRTPKSQRRWGWGVHSAQEGKLMIGFCRAWGWEEGRDDDLHSACHVFQTPYLQSLTQGKA